MVYARLQALRRRTLTVSSFAMLSSASVGRALRSHGLRPAFPRADLSHGDGRGPLRGQRQRGRRRSTVAGDPRGTPLSLGLGRRSAVSSCSVLRWTLSFDRLFEE